MTAACAQLGMFPSPDTSLRHKDRRQIWLNDHEGKESVRIGRYAIEDVSAEVASGWLDQHHYLGGNLPGRGFYHGVLDTEDGELVGVATYGPGGGPYSLPSMFPSLFYEVEVKTAGKRKKKFIEKEKRSAMVLGRFGLNDSVPANSETHILKLSFARAREEHGVRGIVSFSDPVARTTRDGRVVFRGHVGTIYRAHNARYTGRTKPEQCVIFDDATVQPRRSLTAWKNGEKGHEYVYGQLIAQGAAPILVGEPKGEWLAHVLPVVSRPFKHTGQLRYVWTLDELLSLGSRVTVFPYLRLDLESDDGREPIAPGDYPRSFR